MLLPKPDINPRAYDTTLPWYHASFDGKLTSRGRQLFETYGVPHEDIDSHVHEIRAEAWKVFPFPCIGEFFFIEFAISHHPRYEHVVKTLTSPDTSADAGPVQSHPSTDRGTIYDNTIVRSICESPQRSRLLDVGTCVGQDLRMFGFDGVSADLLYGTDIFSDFEAVGHHLFRDRDKFSNRFIHADILDDAQDSPLNQTAGLWDFVTATMFLHQFDLSTQKKIAARLVKLLRPVKGSMILGNNTGQLEAKEIALRPPLCLEGQTRVLYRHSRETMQAMWEAVLDDLGELKESWKISCQYDEREIEKRQEERAKAGEVRFFQGDGQRRIFFTIERLSTLQLARS